MFFRDICFMDKFVIWPDCSISHQIYSRSKKMYKVHRKSLSFFEAICLKHVYLRQIQCFFFICQFSPGLRNKVDVKLETKIQMCFHVIPS